MKLRIVSGELGGRFLTLKTGAPVRPTAERNRSAIADSQRNRIVHGRVADVCAGTGAMGFELLSRGAASVTFVEKDRRLVNDLRSNALIFGVHERCTYVCESVETWAAACTQRFDLIFFDPPYEALGVYTAVLALALLLGENGALIVEYSRHNSPDLTAMHTDGYTYTERRYGDTIMAVFTRSTSLADIT